MLIVADRIPITPALNQASELELLLSLANLINLPFEKFCPGWGFTAIQPRSRAESSL